MWFQVLPHEFFDVLWFPGPTEVELRFQVLPQIFTAWVFRTFPCRCVPSVVESVWLEISIDDEWQRAVVSEISTKLLMSELLIK